MTEDDTIATVHLDGPPEAEIDIQDPLPEASWTFRRILSYLLMFIFAAFVFYLLYVVHSILAVAIDKIDTLDSQDLKEILIRVFGLIEVLTRSSFLFMALVLTYYMVAPSAEQLTKMIQMASILKGKIGLPSLTGHGRKSPRGDNRPANRYDEDDEEDFAPRGRR